MKILYLSAICVLIACRASDEHHYADINYMIAPYDSISGEAQSGVDFIAVISDAAITSNGNVVLLDGLANTVLIYDRGNDLSSAYSLTGLGPGEFSRANRIAADDEGMTEFITDWTLRYRTREEMTALCTHLGGAALTVHTLDCRAYLFFAIRRP